MDLYHIEGVYLHPEVVGFDSHSPFVSHRSLSYPLPLLPSAGPISVMQSEQSSPFTVAHDVSDTHDDTTTNAAAATTTTTTGQQYPGDREDATTYTTHAATTHDTATPGGNGGSSGKQQQKQKQKHIPWSTRHRHKVSTWSRGETATALRRRFSSWTRYAWCCFVVYVWFVV